MVSLDDPEKNKAFAESLDAKLVLLSDPTGVSATAYGVRAFGGLYARRWTFYIDGEGTIRAIDKDVRVDSAGQDIAKKLGELGFPKRGMMTPSRAPSIRGHAELAERSTAAVLKHVSALARFSTGFRPFVLLFCLSRSSGSAAFEGNGRKFREPIRGVVPWPRYPRPAVGGRCRLAHATRKPG